jgi:hypothetical protein
VHTWPALADLRNDTCHRLDRAGAARNIRAALADQLQVQAAEHPEPLVAAGVMDQEDNLYGSLSSA